MLILQSLLVNVILDWSNTNECEPDVFIITVFSKSLDFKIINSAADKLKLLNADSWFAT